MAPQPRKGRGGLIAIIIVIVVIVLIIGVVAAVALGGKKSSGNTGNNSSSTPTVAATPTPSVPSGFQKLTETDFSIDYPGTWQHSGSTGNATFIGPEGQTFLILSLPDSGTSPAELDAAFCSGTGTTGGGSGFGGAPSAPTTVTISGQSWTREECDNSDGTLHAVVESVVYQGNDYLIAYDSTKLTFDSDKTQYFTPMEQSFAFTGQ